MASGELPPHQARFNIAPTDEHFVVRMRRDRTGSCFRRGSRWGLVKYGSKDRKQAARGINARVEGVETRPLYREAFRKRRCVVPADGYYEWVGTKENRQPFWFHRPNGEPAGVRRAVRVVAARPGELGGDLHDPDVPAE